MINVNVAASTGFHLEKWTRVGGKIILRENLGAKELCATVHPLGESGRIPSRKFLILDPLRLLLVHFQTICGFQMTWNRKSRRLAV